LGLGLQVALTCPTHCRTSYSANATGAMMLHGCLDNDTEKGLESDCNVMEFSMAANVTGGSPAVPPGHHHGD